VQWRLPLWLSVPVCAAVCALVLAGCNYGTSQKALPLTGIRSNEFEKTLTATTKGANATAEVATSAATDPETRRALLESVIELIESAPTTPNGKNFDYATDNLNHYFGSVDPAKYTMPPPMRAYLLPRLKERGVTDLESRKFSSRDGRHMEDCLLYHTIASRVAGQGDELSRARAIFDWVVRQIQLVPQGALAPPGSGLPQAQARPYDVLLRGLACEPGGAWAERAWVFISLCRQVGIDVGLLRYLPPGRKDEEARDWICGAAIDGKIYLFDTRIGMVVPSPDGRGVATLEEAATIPEILARLDLPGQSPYLTTSADLKEGKITVLIDSGLGYISSRMKLLQEELTGKKRMILYRDPVDVQAKFAEALGSRFNGIELWRLPLEVVAGLFKSSSFVEATQYSLRFFRSELPLLAARLDQLRGDTERAKEKYVSFRKASNLVMNDRQKTPIPPWLCDGLDKYATYFLALCHLDQGHPDQAQFLFEMSLKELPEPRPEGNDYEMFRWGAQANLARLFDAKGDARRACAYYCAPDPTLQYHGNLLRARDLVWADPTALPPDPLPPAPPPVVFRGPGANAQPAAPPK
jgi:hypothetical protein